MAYDRYARGGDNPWRLDLDTLAMGAQRPSAGPTRAPGAKKIYPKPIGPTVAEGAGRKIYDKPIGPAVAEVTAGPPAPAMGAVLPPTRPSGLGTAVALPPPATAPTDVPNGPPVAAAPVNPMTGLLALAPWLQMFGRGQA